MTSLKNNPKAPKQINVYSVTFGFLMEKYVAYYRVSTAKQGKSGLGLAAQKDTVRNFIGTNKVVIAEFEEIQSGRKDNRQELDKAIALAKREKARLVIARLDRFSRKVSFIANIMEQGIGLTVAELPNATDFQLHIFAALAQEERRLISERTKAALREAKKRGVELGKNGRVLAEMNKKKAEMYGNMIRKNVPNHYCLTSRQIAEKLKEQGIRGFRGADLNDFGVRRYVGVRET